MHLGRNWRNKGEKKVYSDKLELIRDFILENYPVNPEHYIKIETYTGLYQNFWDFYVIVGDLEVFEPSPIIDEHSKKVGKKKVEPEYEFGFDISASYEIWSFEAFGPKIEEKLNILKEIISKEEKITENTLEKVKTLLLNEKAKFPMEPGTIREIQPYMIEITYKENEFRRFNLYHHLKKLVSFWSFFGDDELIIKDVNFCIGKIKEYVHISWKVKAQIGTDSYLIHLEPFHGYIIEMRREQR